jgi:hypothetical protein
MLKIIIRDILLISSIFYLSGCVGEPKIPDNNLKKISVQDSGQLWADSTNIEENQTTIDISGLDKNITNRDNKSQIIAVDVIERVPFPIDEYNQLNKTGKGTINGYIYIESAYGNKIYGKNSKLYLNPITSYSKQWYQESYQGGKKMSKADARLFNYVKFTSSTEHGRFVFYGVPAGGYYLTGAVNCGSECGFDTTKKIRIATEIYIHNNEIINQDISKRY